MGAPQARGDDGKPSHVYTFFKDDLFDKNKYLVAEIFSFVDGRVINKSHLSDGAEQPLTEEEKGEYKEQEEAAEKWETALRVGKKS